MSSASRITTYAAAAFICCASAGVARAGFIENAAIGLGYVGFDIQGQNMPLSGGIDLLVTKEFIGNPQDFGPWDITLQGPISLSVNTGGRVVNELEIGLNTARTENATPTPLNYVLNYDSGGQETQVSGNLLIDGNVSINNFGFYELDLAYSSRQTVVNDGRFDNTEENFDFDLGPVSISGNIYADILAVVTQPLFDAAGQPNPFANFSATSKLNDVLSFSLSELEQRIAAGDFGDLGSVAAARSVGAPLNPAGSASAPAGSVVPEPAVFVLMLVGVAVLCIRRRMPVA